MGSSPQRTGWEALAPGLRWAEAIESLQQLDHRADAASLAGWGQLLSFQTQRHSKGLTLTLTFPASTPRPLSGIEASKSHRVGVGRRRQEGPSIPGRQGAGITIQGGYREEGCYELNQGFKPLYLLHCPTGIYLQNANSKVSLFRISRHLSQSIKSKLQDIF